VYALPDDGRRVIIRPSPVFLGILAASALGGLLAWSSDDETLARLGVFVLVLAGWIASVCLHEFAHAFAAFRGGDRSVEARGYLTLNPLKYAHPVLSLLLPLIYIAQGGIGLPGGAVYLHRHAMRSPAAQSRAAAAGPLTNAALAVVLLLAARSHTDGAHLYFWAGVTFLGFLQVTGAVLNLLPVPGLDGYAIIEPHLDPSTARSLEQVKPFGFLAVILMLQVRQLNSVFFDVVDRLYGLTGASVLTRALGYHFFRFWTD
jgi:Zn-dependent protease